MHWLQTLAFIFSGVASGALSGMLGIGGGIVATPLLRLLGVGPYLAVGTTVLAILPASLTGARSYMKAGYVDWKSAGWAAAGGCPAAFAGARATRLVNGHVLMILSAAVLLGLALRSFPKGRSFEKPPTKRPGRWGIISMGVAAGFFSGLLGIGGGFLMVPALTRWFWFPIKLALGTSLAAISLMIPVNLIGQAQAGNVDWSVAVLLSVGTIPGAALGAAVAIKATDKRLRVMVAGGLTLVAVAYAGLELAALFS